MTPDSFIQIVKTTIGRPNKEQKESLLADPRTPTFIVAGPGSGKTRVLVQRALRHVIVDRFLPEQIVITTFTKKAAAEIRSRLIGWGEELLSAAIDHAKTVGDCDLEAFYSSVDVNRFVTGTLDSLCEDALETSRTPAERRFTLLDPFSAKTLLSRRGMLSAERRTNDHLDSFLGGFTFDGKPTRSTADAVEALKPIADRVIHDIVDPSIFDDSSDLGRSSALSVIHRYDEYLEETAQLDFPRLERAILDKLKKDHPAGALSDARAILVDEYQDTNLLQEQIYLELVKKNSAAFTVVGDDDQSLYRFRGATIELFRDFADRVSSNLNCKKPDPIHLRKNYRSSPDIVDFFNAFIVNDPDFSPSARVQSLKPVTSVASSREPFPILGLFRSGPEDIAVGLADFLFSVFAGDGKSIPGTNLTLRPNPLGGDYGDAVLLSKSVREFGRAAYGNEPKPKFPYFLRHELNRRGVRVFNPRGRPAHDVEAVRIVLGLILESLDPSEEIQSGLAIRQEAKRLFSLWRQSARNIQSVNPASADGTTVTEKVKEMRKLATAGTGSPRDTPALDFVYAFTPFCPDFADDPEHQVYLEGISRAAAQMVSFSGYGGSILRDSTHNSRSIESVLRDFLAPLAEGDIEIDEEIFADVPRSCFNMMTIHQAKGLEFPLVIVDVSSDFKGNYVAQRFKRFPEKPSSTAEIEEAFAPYTSIGTLRQKRTPLQRTFEDIIREYYVAYSRPEAVLLLVGNIKTLATNTKIKHIGQFWRADESWAWTDNLTGPKQPTIAELPFVPI